MRFDCAAAASVARVGEGGYEAAAPPHPYVGGGTPAALPRFTLDAHSGKRRATLSPLLASTSARQAAAPPHRGSLR